MENNEMTQVSQNNGQAATHVDQVDQQNNIQEDFKPDNRTPDELAKRIKALSEESKQYRLRATEERKKREELERKALEEKGQYKELAEKYRAEVEEAKGQAHMLKDAFVQNAVSNSMKAELIREGCLNPDFVLNAIKLDDVSVDVDSGFKPDQTALQSKIAEAKKAAPGLFKQSFKSPNDVVISSNIVNNKINIDKMNSKEIESLLKEKFGKKK